MKRSLKKLLLVIVFITIPLAMNAQFPPPPVGLPIDGGLSLLLGTGLVYAINKLHKKD